MFKYSDRAILSGIIDASKKDVLKRIVVQCMNKATRWIDSSVLCLKNVELSKLMMIGGILCLPMCASAAPHEIVLWHSMAGELGEEVSQLAKKFNDSQVDYRVKPIYKGDYAETLTSFAAAFHAKNPPNLVQVSEVGGAVMRAPKGIIKSVDSLMKEQGMCISKHKIFPGVLEHYSDHGELLAMPFNVSIPIMYYNADALARVGVTPDVFPKTWDELEVLAKRLHEAGFNCAYTTAYPSWILIESYLAIHGLTPIKPGQAYHLDSMTSHLKRIRHWQKQHYFVYGGRVDDATVLFTSGKCPIFSQSSGGYAGLSQMAPFRVGVAPMPLDTKLSRMRHNNVVGGAALWVVAGQSAQMEHGIALFLAFLSQQSVQQPWYEHTGYLPLERPLGIKPPVQSTVLDIATFDLNNPSGQSASQQQGPNNQIRAINDQMLEAIFSGLTDVEQAIQKAGRRINHTLHRFEKNTTHPNDSSGATGCLE